MVIITNICKALSLFSNHAEHFYVDHHIYSLQYHYKVGTVILQMGAMRFGMIMPLAHSHLAFNHWSAEWVGNYFGSRSC